MNTRFCEHTFSNWHTRFDTHPILFDTYMNTPVLCTHVLVRKHPFLSNTARHSFKLKHPFIYLHTRFQFTHFGTHLLSSVTHPILWNARSCFRVHSILTMYYTDNTHRRFTCLQKYFTDDDIAYWATDSQYTVTSDASRCKRRSIFKMAGAELADMILPDGSKEQRQTTLC